MSAVRKFIPRGMGWIPDLPDPRDYTYRHKEILPLLKRLKSSRCRDLPDEVDLRRDDEIEFLMAVEDQGPLNCSSAFAVLSMVEYFERRIRGRAYAGSKLFLYKLARNFRQYHQLDERRLHSIGDAGADLRTSLKIVRSIGVPDEQYWPYKIDAFDEEPSQFLYGIAKSITGLRCLRLDESNCDGDKTWETLLSFLAAGFPVAFGFPVPSSLSFDGNIPYRRQFDSIRGGQAVLAIGYKNNHLGRGQHALLIRSSWGSEWGDHGNGWLPAAFVRNQIAQDFWTLISDEWLDSTELSRPGIIDSRAKE